MAEQEFQHCTTTEEVDAKLEELVQNGEAYALTYGYAEEKKTRILSQEGMYTKIHFILMFK